MTARALLLVGLTLIVGITWALAVVSKRFEHVASGVAPLETRRFDALTVISVGTGGTFENQWRLGPATAVAIGEDLLLVDAGRGLAGALRQAEIPVEQPRAVLLTSLLPENTVGLDDLILTGWLSPRSQPLRVYGPSGTRAAVDSLLQAHRAGIETMSREWDLTREATGVESVEIEDGAEFSVGALAVRAALLPGGTFPALAYRIGAGSRSAVVASVGFGQDALLTLGRGADLLVHEAIYGASLEAALEAGADRADALRHEAESHPKLETIGALAREMGVATLVLTRLRPPPVYDFQYARIVKTQFVGRVLIASDGDEITP